jgi:hypothetical protein
MPTVFKKGPYRFYFYSHEPNEPVHIHVDRDALSVKFWLESIELARNYGFSPKELRIIRDIIFENKQEIVEVWNGYFSIIGG